jgi:hypothetical protein
MNSGRFEFGEPHLFPVKTSPEIPEVLVPGLASAGAGCD